MSGRGAWTAALFSVRALFFLSVTNSGFWLISTDSFEHVASHLSDYAWLRGHPSRLDSHHHLTFVVRQFSNTPPIKKGWKRVLEKMGTWKRNYFLICYVWALARCSRPIASILHYSTCTRLDSRFRGENPICCFVPSGVFPLELRR